MYGFVANEPSVFYDELGLKLGIGKNVPCDEVDQFLLDARLVSAAYLDNANGIDEDGDPILPDGWRHTGITQDSNTGSSSSIFKGPNGERVVAFRGTQMTGGPDWRTNISQGAGLYGQQYRQVQQMSRNGSTSGATRVVGHSLSGGLAAAYGAARNLPTTTFKAAGVHRRTSREFADSNDNNVDSVVVGGEILYTGQDSVRLAVPDSNGDKNYLNPARTAGPIALQGMDAVIEALKKRKNVAKRKIN